MSIELTDSERAARTILEDAREASWSPTRASICNVFRAMWANALTSDEVIAISLAMGPQYTKEAYRPAVRKELTRMVRAGHLRSRKEGSRRLYEVNY